MLTLEGQQAIPSHNIQRPWRGTGKCPGYPGLFAVFPASNRYRIRLGNQRRAFRRTKVTPAKAVEVLQYIYVVMA